MSNLLNNPESFNLWTLVANAAVNADQETALDDTNTVDQFIDNAATGVGQCAVRQNVTLDGSSQYVLSVFIKPDQLDWAWLWFDHGSSTVNCYFDCANGVIGTDAGSPDDVGIEVYADGWCRIWIVATSNAAAGSVRIYLADADGDTIVDLDGTSSIFPWGALLELGSSPSNYVSENGDEIQNGQALPYIAVTRRKSSEMIVRPRMPKPRNSLRGKFE